MTKKRRPTELDMRLRRWHGQLQLEAHYHRFQVVAMERHFAATPCLDYVVVAPHGPDLGPLGEPVMMRRT